MKMKILVKLTNLPNVVANTLPDSVLQLVLGDGACYMRCLAVHLGKNEEEGLELSKQYNKHISKNREVSSKFISFPKTTTVSTSMHYGEPIEIAVSINCPDSQSV